VRYTWTWILWLGAFLVAEGLALVNKKPGDTLSEHAWKWFAVKDEEGRKNKAWRLRRVAITGFLAWLLVHIGWGV
jgi:hypothetical protein